MRSTTAVFLVLLVLSCSPALAQGRGGQPPQTPPAAADSTPRVETAGEKEEKISQTSHAMRLDGRDIKYTATTGTLPIRLDNGQVAARMFYEAGHMIYIRPSEHRKLKNDVAKFIQGTRGQPAGRGTSQP